jgi:hypothetical protein
MVGKRTSHAAPARARRGRPLIHDEAWSKVSVVLMDRQIIRLDRLVRDIHARTGAVITRAGVIRAFVDGVIDSGIDVISISSELELRARIATRLAPLGLPARSSRRVSRES